jgi:hypothetical protein
MFSFIKRRKVPDISLERKFNNENPHYLMTLDILLRNLKENRHQKCNKLKKKNFWILKLRGFQKKTLKNHN